MHTAINLTLGVCDGTFFAAPLCLLVYKPILILLQFRLSIPICCFVILIPPAVFRKPSCGVCIGALISSSLGCILFIALRPLAGMSRLSSHISLMSGIVALMALFGMLSALSMSEKSRIAA